MADLEYTLVINDSGTATIKRVTQSLKEAGTAGVDAGKQASDSMSELDRTLGRLQRTAAAFIAMWVMREVVGGFMSLVEMGIKFNSTMEDSKLGIAAILMASGQFVDSTGKGVTGWSKMNAALELSGNLMEEIKVRNLETFATTEQIVKAYQLALGYGLRLGGQPQDMIRYTVAMVQAAGALRVDLDMMGVELRSLMTGTISPRISKIATVLGITPEDIHRLQGDFQGLMAFITGKLEAFSYAGVLMQKSWTGLLSNVKSAISNVLGEGMMPLFEYLKEQLGGVQGYIIHLNEQTGRLELNPDLITDIKAVSEMMVGLIKLTKLFGEGLGILTIPLKGIADLVAYQQMLSGMKESKGPTTPAWDIMKQTPFGQMQTKVRPELYGLMTTTPEMQNLFGMGGQASGLNYVPNLPTKIVQEQAEVLMKITAETGHMDEALKAYIVDQGIMKKLGIDVLGLSNEQLTAAMKTTEEYDRALKATEAKGGVPGVLEPAFKDLMNVRLAIAAIKEQEPTLKILQSIAQATDQYEAQKAIVLTLNKYEEAKLLATKTLTPELKKQIDAMNAQAKLSVEEIDRKKELKSLSITRDIISQAQEYAKITGNIEAQISASKELEDNAIRLLRIDQNKVGYGEEWLEIQNKILAIRKTGGEQRGQEAVALPITQYLQPLAQVQKQFAETTGNFREYTRAAWTDLENTITLLRNQTKEAGTYNEEVEKRIGLMRDDLEVQLKIKDIGTTTGQQTTLLNLEKQYLELMSGHSNNLQELIKNNKDLEVEEVKRLTGLMGSSPALSDFYQKQIDWVKKVGEETRTQMANKEIVGVVTDVAIERRISNAIIRVKKGAVQTVGCIRAREAEKQPSSRSHLIIHPSVRPEYLDGRWPRCS